jgi:deoxyribodipyrimidine photo-lyase
MPTKAIFIFRRDYRAEDNVGLIHACQECETVLPVFIFTPEQAIASKNPYFSHASFQFLTESLFEFEDTLRQKYHSGILYLFGENRKALQALHKSYPFDAIYTNMDYTPYARDRDADVEAWSTSTGVEYKAFEDYLLHPMGTLLKKDGAPYTKYTPFRNNAYKVARVPEPTSFTASMGAKLIAPPARAGGRMKITRNKIKSFYQESATPDLLLHGGREEALRRLRATKDFGKYASTRNILSKPTTLLSPYINFGCVSIRECFHTIKEELGMRHGLNDQFLWREFWYYIGYHFPHVINYKRKVGGPSKNRNMWPEYDRIVWKNPKKAFEAWCEGRTGFPAVDAGMREINTTGYMHNRARLIVSGILVKNFGVDWRWGEEYFSKKLVDINAPVNSGNWQWSASTGENKGDYYRIMNPWTQSEKFDKQAEYIKKWIPELKDVPPEDIHHWDQTHSKYPDIEYPAPILEYGPKMRQDIMQMYKSAMRR